jgi:Arylsulfotransferase (ASST)
MRRAVRMRRLQGSWAALIALAGCGSEPTDVRSPPQPVLQAVTVTAPPDNVLSILVTGSVRFADSVAVRYGTPGTALDSVTPVAQPADSEVALPVFGLLPDTAYELRMIAFGEGGTVQSEPLHITTGSLPADLPRFVAGGPAPSPGYVLFSAGTYGIVIDNTGRVVWYVRFALGPSLNFQAQPNGRYVARPTTLDPSDVEPLIELDPLGNITRTLDCARGLRPRFHDLMVEPDGSYWLMCDEVHEMDLSALGGAAGAKVTGTVVQHLDAAGNLLFDWSPFDHFDITDVDQEFRSGPLVNWTHGNALDLDPDGNLIVSFRSLSEITKIDTSTGNVLWRMGGRRNQFAFPDSGPPFVRQHGVRVVNGEIVLLDNLGEADGSRAERYAVDEAGLTASRTAAYAPTPSTRAMLGGTTQTLPDGHTLVAFGDGGAVQEFDSEGAMVWHIEGNAGYVFRAQRIQSLYQPEVGLVR